MSFSILWQPANRRPAMLMKKRIYFITDGFYIHSNRGIQVPDGAAKLVIIDKFRYLYGLYLMTHL